MSMHFVVWFGLSFRCYIYSIPKTVPLIIVWGLIVEWVLELSHMNSSLLTALEMTWIASPKFSKMQHHSPGQL